MFAFLKVSLKAVTSSEKLKHPSSFEASTVRFLSSAEDTHVGMQAVLTSDVEEQLSTLTTFQGFFPWDWLESGPVD